MNILLPIEIVEAMIMEGTNIPAVDTEAGEVAWISGQAYAVKDRRVWRGGTYECMRAITGAPQNTWEPSDGKSAGYWERDENAPTNRMAPFDEYLFTKAKKAGEIKYILNVPFFNGLAMYEAEADQVDVNMYDLPRQSGDIPLVTHDAQLWEQAPGLWEYLFGNINRTNKFTVGSFPMRPASELIISLKRSDPSNIAELGYLSIGQWYSLFAPQMDKGGAEYGAEVTPKSYGVWRTNSDGTYVRRKGRIAKIITASVLIDARDAPGVTRLFERIIDIPVAVEISDLPKYGHLSTVGRVTGSVRSENSQTARVNVKVEGNI